MKIKLKLKTLSQVSALLQVWYTWQSTIDIQVLPLQSLNSQTIVESRREGLFLVYPPGFNYGISWIQLWWYLYHYLV